MTTVLILDSRINPDLCMVDMWASGDGEDIMNAIHIGPKIGPKYQLAAAYSTSMLLLIVYCNNEVCKCMYM